MRGCSRKRPTTENTRIWSVSPGTPGRRQQMPRTLRVMGTPAWLAWASLSMSCRSVTELTLMKMPHFSPLLAFSISPSISSSSRGLREWGATSSCWYSPSRLEVDMFWKKAAASAPMAGLAVMRQKSVYSLAVFSL